MNKGIILYGASGCHKTTYYKTYLSSKDLEFIFYDVLSDKKRGEELRSLYESRKLNFPTLIIEGKKLRNPTLRELKKQLVKHNFLEKVDVVEKYGRDLTFTCGIDKNRHDCGDAIEY